LIPDLSSSGDHWFSLSAIVLSLTGVELTSVHAAEVRDPKRDYPRSLLISTIFILLILSLGSLSIAVIVPPQHINLIEGMMTAFSRFFQAYQLPWMIPVIAVCLICGAIAAINNWIIGPTKGLLTAANDGFFPAFLRKKNKHGAPVALLIAQGIIVSILSFVFLFLPTVNQSYWLFTVLTTATYMIMYILVFLSFIRLRFSKPHHPRPYKVPGGKVGMWIVCALGLLSSSFTLAISFIPPNTIYEGNAWQYILLFTSGLVLVCIPPLLLQPSKNVSKSENV
jgi:glutamate:GABA antiporter